MFKPGQVVRFTYRHARVDQHTGDKFKEVFVLNPEWQGKMHGIDLRRVTTAEREVLRAIMDPNTVRGQHKIPLVNDILHRMNPIERIKNPLSFYNRFVKVFLRKKDAYRMYWVKSILNSSVVHDTEVSGKTFNPKPLFKKAKATKPPAPTIKTRMDDLKDAHRRALIKKAAEKLAPKQSEVPSPDKKVNRMDLIKAAAAKAASKGKKDVPSPDPAPVNRLDALRQAQAKAEKNREKASRVYDDDVIAKREKEDQYSKKKPTNAEEARRQREREAAAIAAFLAKKQKEKD